MIMVAHTSIHNYMYMMHTCIHAYCIYIYACTYICTYICMFAYTYDHMHAYVHTVGHSAYMYDAACIHVYNYYVHMLLNLTINFNDRAHSVMNLWHFIAQTIFYSHMKLSDC